MKTKLKVYKELDRLPRKLTPAPNAFVYVDDAGRLNVRVDDIADFIIEEDYVSLDETT
jgi:hypothetical protein